MAPDEFKEWFEIPLQKLNDYQHGGFAVLMISLPLAERLFRERSGCFEGSLTNAFYTEFCKEFPTLPPTKAPDFWHAYRNGLLHQATFSSKNIRGRKMPGAWISANPKASQIIEYHAGTDEFIVRPRNFSETIVQLIKSNYSEFIAPGSPNHTLATVTSPLAWKTGPKSTSTDGPGASGCP